MLSTKSSFYLVILALSILISSQIVIASSQQHNGTAASEGVEDILKDTILLLDALDQKLYSVNNRTPNALMRDNLRALSGFQLAEDVADSQSEQQSAQQSSRRINHHEEAHLLDETLTKLADGFASGRRINQSGGDLMASASNNHDQTSSSTLSMFSENDNKKPGNEVIFQKQHQTQTSAKRARLLQPAAPHQNHQNQRHQQDSFDNNQQLASDSTERHIKFTLDLMQSIFASELFSSKTNLIESFLISPLSIQSVLMMMHLGARGQTRRELANCLHLNNQDQTVSVAVPTPTTTPTTSTSLSMNSQQENKQKKIHQHQHLQATSSNSEKQSNQRQQHQKASVSQQRSSQQQISNAAHELFGAAVRNLLKDPIVMKALTNANQIFLQKNLPLSPQYEWSIRHYYGADIKQVDFQHQLPFNSSSGLVNTNESAPSSTSPLIASTGSDKTTTQAASNSSLSASPSQNQQQQQASTSGSSASATSEQQQQQQTNLQQMINDWVERQTRGRISKFLSSPISTSTLMMVINVLFFKGDWQYKFDPSDTEQDAWFTQANGKVVKMPMMVNRLPLAFAHDPQMKVSVIELPYKAQRLGLFLLLPDEISGIFQLMQSLNSTSFANLISSMRKPNQVDQVGNTQTAGGQQNPANGVNVRIPKFSIESSPRLSLILSQQLGLKSLFSPDIADLSGIFAQTLNQKRSSLSQSNQYNNQTSGNNSNSSSSLNNQQEHQTNNNSNQTPPPAPPPQVGLDELLHKAVLQVDEQGSVAAASSATIVERVGLFNNNYFEADHPFLLFLMDKQTGLVLFSGAFAGNNNPSGLIGQQSITTTHTTGSNNTSSFS